MSALPRLHRPEEVAEALGLSAWWVKSEARQGRIPATRVGSSWRFTAAQYQQIVAAAEQPVQAPAQSSRSTARPYYADSAAPAAPLTPRAPRRRTH
ncbi:helix-turn-helix domain-containing protein [Streptomyces sp. NPDC057325]|uniref:helix-turn-helix domain-containing protein n=1 Tax=unclassified Streptomyces TaxID=2593676 RepID=UPI00362D2087